MSDHDVKPRQSRDEDVHNAVDAPHQHEPASATDGWQPSRPAKFPEAGQPLPGAFANAEVPYYLRASLPAQKSWLDDDVQQKLHKLDGDAATVPPAANYVEVRPTPEIAAGHGDPVAPEPTGRQTADIQEFADFTQSLAPQWQTLDPSATADQMRKFLNEQNAREGIPPVRPSTMTPKGGLASFGAGDWKMKLAQEPLASADDVIRLAGAEEHENTHAISDFRAARLADPQQAHASMPMKESIAEQAHRVEVSGAHPMSDDDRATAAWLKEDLITHADAHHATENRAEELNDDVNQVNDTTTQMDDFSRMLVQSRMRESQPAVNEAVDQYARLPSEQRSYAAEAAFLKTMKSRKK